MLKFGSLFFFLLNIIIYPVFSQESIIKVLSEGSNEPLPFSNVCIESINGKDKVFVATDAGGKIRINITQKSLIAVSYVGFEYKIDTIYPGQNKSIFLKPSAYTTEEMVVSAQYQPVKADQSIYKIDVISINRLDQRKATNVSELLAAQPYIKINHDGALGSKISMNGLTGEHIKILVDGIPVIGRMDGNIDLSQLNLSNVDHIEIIDGPMSVVYGSNALAGAINIITKENRAYRLLSNVDAYYENVGVYNFSAYLSGKINKSIYTVNASRNFFDGFKITDSLRSFDWNPKRQYETGAFLIQNFKQTKLKISANYFNELLLDKGNLMAPYFETAFDRYFYTNRLTTNLDVVSKFMDNKHFINFLTSYSYYSRHKNTFFKDLTTLEKQLTTNSDDHDTSVFDAYIARAFLSKNDTSSFFNYQLGFDFNAETGLGKRIANQLQTIADYALFVSTRFDLKSKLQLQPGLRLSYNTRYRSTPVYSVNIRYSPLTKLNVRASFARGFRAPSLKELFLNFVDVNHNVMGNPCLESESSYNANTSVNYNISSGKHFFTIDAGLFYNRIHNIITLAQISGIQFKYINLARYQTQGGQLSFTYKMHPRFNFYTAWSLTGTSALTNSQELLQKKYYYQQITSGLSYKNTKYRFGWSLDAKYYGKKPQIFIDNNENLKLGFIEPYSIVDITVKKYFLEDKILLSVGVKNLMNYVNIVTTGIQGGVHSGGDGFSQVGWGRTFFVNLSFNLNRL